MLLLAFVEIQRNCTALGWSDPVPPYHVACHIEDLGEIPQSQVSYLATLKVLYTTGHVVSLIALITAISIFCLFRKLHCTRNYIHIHLFTSFVLRVTSIFIKDVVLFADEDINHCTISTVTCKWAVSLSQFCVLANFSWLLVEGLYLQTLLALTFVSDRRYFWWFIGIGWGQCWDNYDNAYRWVIKASILVTIFVTFLIFLNVIRILIHKICSGRLGGVDRQQCLRLAKSTLLLIPLFGVHYVVFALVPERVGLHARLCFELVLGSLQGFIIALLYCFLNSETAPHPSEGLNPTGLNPEISREAAEKTKTFRTNQYLHPRGNCRNKRRRRQQQRRPQGWDLHRDLHTGDGWRVREVGGGDRGRGGKR
eukprot:gi/632977855/ref/XP_007905579.1/ PREDICTED: vasoactive intestinal polypeptide receptor-like [Callorhinchus milii]